MKRKNFRLNLASFVVFLLVGVMGVTAAFTAFIGNNAINPNVSTNSAIQAGQAEDDLASVLDPNNVLSTNKALGKDDKVVLIVTMDENSLIDTYLANPGSYTSFSDYRVSTEGKNAAENLINKQKALYNKIARQIDVSPKYNYVNTMNGFAIEVKYGDRKAIDAIVNRANALGTMISEHYDAPEIQAVENHVAAMGTGIFDSINSRTNLNIAGQGMVAAVLDTGLDWEHVAFDPNHPLFDLENQKKNGTLKFTKEYIESKLPELTYANGLLSLNMSASTDQEMEEAWKNEGYDGETYLTIKDVYKNEKVPYVFDYADFDTEVNSHVDNAHGTHVAGIIAGHSDDPKGPNGETLYDKDDKEITGITGVAPQAQLAIFKVFSDYSSGAGSFSLLGALEDCITLGVDVINMSLGATAGFAEDEGSYHSIYKTYERVGKVGISLIVAAGNEYSTGYNSHAGLNLTSNPDSGAIGTPSSYKDSFTVASISGVKSQYLEATYDGGTATAYYNESVKVNGTQYNFMEDIVNIIRKRLADPAISDSRKAELRSYIKQGDINTIDPKDPNAEYELQVPYVTIPGVGQTGNYAGKDVTDKIVLVSRGQINFEEKLKEATSHKALGCIVFNNAAGIIGMQVGDDIEIPSCSITMDVAALIKNKDGNGRPAYFTVNPQKKAGPFMSEFSNWGPLPNLVLKPEITAHGGEIYSAIPGDETAYSRFSGTSMACPNMAGVVALLRQYMKSTDKNGELVGKKFGLDKNNDGKIEGEVELNLMEQRIYQILMSTATIALDEEGNPYSPRKQGAGLADLDRSEAVEQYLYVMKDGEELERTKVELGDDPTRSGVYNVEFYVKNASSSSVEYTVSSHVMTEGISTDGKTVTQKARLLTAYTADLKVNGAEKADGKVTVAPKSEAKITYTITLGDKDREWLANFKNGMYVEGFVCLENAAQDGINLNIPYLAFYGDWTDAPIMDYDIYETTKDANDDNIDDDDKRYSNAQPLVLIGKVYENGQEFTLPMGQYVFNPIDAYPAPDAEEDHCALSFDTANSMCSLYGVAGFLRGAKKLFWQITDVVTGDVMTGGCYPAARKASATAGSGGAYFDIDMSQFNFSNNHLYNFTCYPVIDWHSEDFRTIQDVIDFNVDKMISRCTCSDKERCIKDEDCVDAKCACEGNKIRYYWSSNFWYDTDAPFISNTELRVVRDSSDNASYFLDLHITDNHYTQAIGMTAYNKDTKKFESVFSEDGSLRPITSQRNSTTIMSLNITYMWEQIQDGIQYQIDNARNPAAIAAHPELGTDLTKFKVTLYDYAFNRSYYTIDLMYLYEYLQAVKFGDIGNYNTYKDSDDNQVNVMTSYNKTPKEDSTMTSITIIEGQKVDLMKAVVATPATAWREDFVFSCRQPEVVKVDNETGEIYGAGAGEATVTLTSKVNNRITPATITVRVLSIEEANRYRIPVKTLQADQNLNSLSFKVAGKYFNAGEEYIIELEHDPWYYDLEGNMLTADELEAEIKNGKFFMTWTSNNEFAATVRPMVPADAAVFGETYSVFKAVVTATRSYNSDGEYVKRPMSSATITARLFRTVESSKDVDPVFGPYESTIYSARFSAYVMEEFVTTGNELTGYHGTPVYDEETGYMTVTIPSNLNITSIAALLFIEKQGIECVILPEGLETIGRGAFAYMKDLKKIVFPSTLQKIDTYAFIASYSITDEGPTTSLSIVDTTRCAKPLQVAEYAFANQRYIGVDLTKSVIYDIGEDKDNKNKIVLLDKAERDLFDTKMVRVADRFAFANLMFVKSLDLTGLRASAVGSFVGLGSYLHKYFTGDDAYADVKLGEHTIAGIATFYGSGIGKLTIPMRRVGAQMFYGMIEEQDEVHENEEEQRPDTDTEAEYHPLYIGELEEIVFTSDDLVIETGAFLYTSVKKVTFEGSVASIGDAAFLNSLLEKVEFKKECRKIGVQAFAQTNIGMTEDGEAGEFKLPAGLEKLGSSAFMDCKYINKLVIDKDCKWTTAGQEGTGTVGAPFYACDSLAEFEVEEGNQYLSTKGTGALYSKDGETLIGIPYAMEIEDASEVLVEGVTKLGAYAFAGNENIKTADLSNIDVLGECAFYMCSNLEKVILPERDLPMGIFYECESLAEVIFPDKVDTQNPKMTKIGDIAFAGTAFEQIDIPETVTEIGSGAFMENTKLKSFTFPMGVTEIPDAMFFRCESLEHVNTLSPGTTEGYTDDGSLNRIQKVGVQAFVYTGIHSISLRSCTYVGEQAFAGCANLESINLPIATEIADYAFAGGFDDETGRPAPSALTSISVPMATRIGEGAFAYNPSIEYVALPSCTEIANVAFYSCSSLSAILIPSAETIGRLAFANTAVNRVAAYSDFDDEQYNYNAIFGSRLKYMHPTAFTASSILAYVFAEANATYFDNEYALYRVIEGGYELVAVPSIYQQTAVFDVLDGTVRIGEYALYFNQLITKVNIPASVKWIGDSAFADSSVRLYSFNTLQAPELEAGYATYTTENYNDTYFWQVYNNFYRPFTYMPGIDAYKYSNVRPQAEDDEIVEAPLGGTLQNESYLGEGFTHYPYGIIIERPSNAKGFDNFVWANYFDNEKLTAELLEDNTVLVMDLIRALPEPNRTTSAHKEAIEIARSRYDSLPSEEQKLFVYKEGLLTRLEACERKLVELDATDIAARQNVVNLISALPDPENIVLKDSVVMAVEDARDAYNALSSSNKTVFNEEHADLVTKLEECEAKIAELKKGGNSENKEGCGSCGTVAFGAGNNGGTGLMIGLFAAMLVSLLVVLLRKKKSAQR